MTSFEEEFPELKNKRYSPYDVKGEFIHPISSCLHIEDCMEHCKSNKRVREVLDKWGNISLENNTLTELIKEDLGLK